MKKIILTVIAVLSMTTATAENENMNSTNAFSMNVKMENLGRALNLSNDQLEVVKDVHSSFCADMMNAAAADKADRKEMVNMAVKRDLIYMRALLDREQFRKYRAILNATFVNRGLINEL